MNLNISLGDILFAAGGATLDSSLTLRIQVVGSTAYHHMSGPSVLNQTRECAIAFNATKDPNPAHFAANEFLDSTIAFENGTVVSLVHTE